jgi:cytoskeletal protein CcmA (bactofilin family)
MTQVEKDGTMSAALGAKPETNKLYIGEGVTIKGAVVVPDTVVVDGVLEGDISVANLLVRENGTIKGRVAVSQNAEIFGKVLERLDVRGLLVLRASSRVEGNVSCGMLTIEQGASITGGIASALQGAQPSFASERRQDARPGSAAPSLKRLHPTALEVPSPIAARA